MSKIPGFVIGPAPGYVQQPVPCTTYIPSVQQQGGTIVIPPVAPGSRIMISQQTPVTPAPVYIPAVPPAGGVVYLNRSQPSQLGLIGARFGMSVGNTINSVVAPVPQYVVHQYPAAQPQYPTAQHHHPPPYTATGYAQQTADNCKKQPECNLPYPH